MSYARSNLLTRGMRGDANTISGISFAWDGDWYHVSGTATGDVGWRAYKSSDIPVKAGRTYTLSIDFDGDVPDGYLRLILQFLTDVKKNVLINVAFIYRDPLHVTFTVPDGDYEMLQLWGPIIKGGATVDMRCRWILVAGDTPAAWAPAEGEELAGGGALMSANLWDASTVNHSPDANGVYLAGKSTGELQSAITGASALAENQTIHMGASLRGADKGCLKPFVGYKDAAGNPNWTGFPAWTPNAEWQRFEATCVVPSGMTITYIGFNVTAATGDIEVMNPAWSYGSPVTLASSAHTPYATQDHVSVTYATKASLKVTDDSIKAEVSARAQTDQNVADLSSRLTQTANSLTTEISDRRSAITTVTGLANAAQSTADGAAKQANLYTIGLGDAGAVAKWIHLGTLTSAGDSSSATISIVFGHGYNGGANQNSTLTLTVKDGYQNPKSATGACGVSVMRENCDNALVDVLAQSATVYDVWVYAPWAYSDGRYSISGQYAAWQHSGATQKAEPATSATQVKQDVAYRLADATKAQTMATENQSSIRQLSDSITAEVTERSKLAGRVGTLESTSGTHTSKLEQLATSIKSLVKGESTYTDPDGKSATSGIYSLVTQTRDSVTALFGSYTKTADLASTEAVKDAKKAGTDAQAAASAAQTTADSAKSTAQAAASDAATAKTNASNAVSTANSASTSAANAVETANAASSTASSASSTANSAVSTANAAKTSAASAVSTANSASSTASAAQSTADTAKANAATAQSTANAAKGTADSLATMIREDATGITVGKSADGQTWSTGRTRMTDSAFEVLDKAGKVLSSFGKDKVRLGVDGAQIDMAGGRLLIDAQDHAASEMPSGLPTTITRMICPSSNSGKNDTEMYLGAYDKDSGNVVGGMGITVTRETDGSYNTSAGISGSLSAGSATLVTPLPVSSGGTGATSLKAARKNLQITQGSKVCHGHGTAWVKLFESWDEFQSATGCYDSARTPTLVTMNGDYSAFDGALSDCEIKGGEAVYVMARTTDGPHTLDSSNSVRINWICIW